MKKDQPPAAQRTAGDLNTDNDIELRMLIVTMLLWFGLVGLVSVTIMKCLVDNVVVEVWRIPS